jgi:phosphatidylserine decarboxylase
MDARQKAIPLYNRWDNTYETETVYGRRWMDLCYQSPMGRCFTSLLLARRPVSALYGYLQKHPRSRKNIRGFTDQYNVDLTRVITPPGGFESFNDFFIRRLKPGQRPIDPDPRRFISPADSRLQVYNLGTADTIRIKGMNIRLAELLGRRKPPWHGGTVLVFRLAPCDYHRFGHVADGVQGTVHTVQGNFHSVNPLAVQHKPDILMTNFRQWCFVQSPQWGTLIQVEVGAMMVGSIVQHFPGGGPCRRGKEKGYFQFGGSTVVVAVQSGCLEVDEDIRRHSALGIETRVRFGEAVGSRRIKD